MKQDINNVNWLTDKAAFVVIFMIQCALTLQLINMAICICGIGSVELETVVFIHFFNRRNPIPTGSEIYPSVTGLLLNLNLLREQIQTNRSHPEQIQIIN